MIYDGIVKNIDTFHYLLLQSKNGVISILLRRRCFTEFKDHSTLRIPMDEDADEEHKPHFPAYK